MVPKTKKKRVKKPNRVKKVKLTREQAGELEYLLGEYIGDRRGEHELRGMLKSAGITLTIVGSLIDRWLETAASISSLRSDLSCANIVAAADDLRRLDKFMAKTFEVDGPKYRWLVWD